jgi:tight adherence protein C
MKFKLGEIRNLICQARSCKSKIEARRIIWPLCGFLLFEICYLFALVTTTFSIYKLTFFDILGLISGDRANKKQLTIKSKNRILSLKNDFPYFAEHLALCVTAGLSPVIAIRTILDTELIESFSTALNVELNKLLLDINHGKSATLALDEFAKQINLPEIYRFVDVLIVTMERGTPLAEVLRQQALDLREAQRREYLDLGNNAEVKMMVPVVFLILPVSILFALWPSLYQLNQMSTF